MSKEEASAQLHRLELENQGLQQNAGAFSNNRIGSKRNTRSDPYENVQRDLIGNIINAIAAIVLPV